MNNTYYPVGVSTKEVVEIALRDKKKVLENTVLALSINFL